IRNQTRVLQSLPRDLKQEPLLRVHFHCFPRRDTKKRRVEHVRVFYEPPHRSNDFPRSSGIWVVNARYVETAANLRNRFSSAPQQRPELGRVLCPRETAPYPDYCDRLVYHSRLVPVCVLRAEMPRSRLPCGLIGLRLHSPSLQIL